MQQDLDFICALARSAGAIVREHQGRTERLTKQGDEAVTALDRDSQRHIVAGLTARFPNDGILGEENDAGTGITFIQPRSGKRVWVIDPIDGTNNFVAGLGNFAVCIGLLDDGYPILGVVYDVMRDQVFAGARHLGATCNGQAMVALTTPPTAASLLMLTSNMLDAQGRMPTWAAALHAQTTWKIRVLGSAALEAVMVGAGIAHGSITINAKLWDIAAAAAVILAAGGGVISLNGKAVFPFDLTGYNGGKVPFLAVCPSAKEALLNLVKTP
jgi:myo-inositol-1(or 4)-monophosphatase